MVILELILIENAVTSEAADLLDQNQPTRKSGPLMTLDN